MKIQTNRTLSTIAMILLLTISAMMATMPAADAHTPAWNIPTWTYISVSPSPIGTGQQALIAFWTDKVPQTANGQYGDRWQFTVQVTKPDNSVQTIGPITSDPIGGGYTLFTPSAVGTYYFQAFFPKTVLAGANPMPGGNQYSTTPYVNDTYLASTSQKASLIVQQAQITPYQSTPLPTGYWGRPIYATNREWYTIAGNWLNDAISTNRANIYTAGPQTAHIVWTKQLDFGGITGGSFSDIGYYTGSAYETKFSGAIIMQGRLYYNAPKSDQPSVGGLTCVDLRTGQQIWWQNNTSVNMGEIYDYESPNQHGTIAYLISSSGGTMRFYDPFSGAWLYSITNVPSGTAAVGPNGEALIYQWDLTRGWLALWNSSAIPALLLSQASGTDMWQWRPVGKTVNGTTGYQWNATIPKDLPRQGRDLVQVVYTNNVPEMILGSSGFVDRWTTSDPYTLYAISLKPGQEGQMLWRKAYSPPIANGTLDPGYGMVIDSTNRVFCLPLTQTMQWYGYSMDTGALLWGPTTSQADYDYYRMVPLPVAVNGMFYTGGYGGIVYAYDIKTGKTVWASTPGSVGLEGPYEYWPMGTGSDKTYADGKLYISTNEHSNTMPLYRGWSIYCIDALTGKGLWNITGLMGALAVAEGYAIGFDSMDNQIYCFGKGRTATTVTAPDVAIPQGSQVLIKGTVTDQSPGQTSLGIPVAGTPAISDDSMSAWMEYLYHQRSEPMDAKGVTVALTAFDPNGNTEQIGNVVSDLDGNFMTAWTPPVPGVYKITATFAGSGSYFGSHAETGIVVSQAASARPTATAAAPTPIQTVAPTVAPTAIVTVAPTPSPVIIPPTSANISATYIAIGAVVLIIIAAAAALILRRRR